MITPPIYLPEPTTNDPAGYYAPCTVEVVASTGSDLDARHRLELSTRELWLLIEAANTYVLRAPKDQPGHLDTIATVRAMEATFRAFWTALMAPPLSRRGAHAPPLRLSNRDEYHSPTAHKKKRK
jgi:hypothetical protein